MRYLGKFDHGKVQTLPAISGRDVPGATQVRLESIYVYPLKSARRVPLASAHVEQRGLRHDRRWMVTDASGRFLSQRDVPGFAVVRVSLASEGLSLEAPGMPRALVCEPSPDAATVPVQIWKDTVEASLAGPEAEAWMSDYAGRPCRLVYMPGKTLRRLNPAYATGIVSFADGYPLLVTTLASLEYLNSRMDMPVDMSRFRPNIVIAGSRPYEEDNWKRICIGSVCFRVAKPCDRCVVTTIDQDTAEQGKEPLRTMGQYRKRGSGVYFGQNLVPEAQGEIRVGDTVEVLE